MVVVLAACAISLAMAWRTQQRLRGIEQELVRRQQESANQSTEARVLSKTAEDSARESAAKVAVLEARLAEVSAQRGQLDDMIAQLSRSRDDGVVADVESAVRVATQQMFLTGSVEPLVVTLHQVDVRLTRANQPRLETVRRAIARDLERLRSVSGVNVSSLSMRLDELVRVIDELPLTASAAGSRGVYGAAAPASTTSSSTAAAASQARRGAARTAASSSAPADTGSRWQDAWTGFWTHVWTEARGLVRVTRIDHPEAMLVAPDNAFYLRENLKLRLLNARLAVLSRQFDSAQTDLQAVETTLSRYFDPGSRRVALALESVKTAASQARQVTLPRPDDTLAALTALTPTR